MIADLQIQTSDVVKFVLANRHGLAFRKFNEFDVASEFLNHHYIVVVQQQNVIHAVATGDIKDDRLYVRQVLTTRPQDLALLAKLALKSWPYIVDIAFRRRGRECIYDFQKLMFKLLYANG